MEVKRVVVDELPDICVRCPFENDYISSLHLDTSECTAVKPNRVIEFEVHLYGKPNWCPLVVESKEITQHEYDLRNTNPYDASRKL